MTLPLSRDKLTVRVDQDHGLNRFCLSVVYRQGCFGSIKKFAMALILLLIQ